MEIINMILNIIIGMIIIQLTTTLHEFGHAIPALFFTKDKVTMYLGVGKNNDKNFNIANLEIIIRGFHPFTGFVYWKQDKLSTLQKIMVVAGGPLVSLLISIGLFLLTNTLESRVLTEIIKFTAYYNFYQFIVTAIPIKYPSWWGTYAGTTSDGYKTVELLKM